MSEPLITLILLMGFDFGCWLVGAGLKPAPTFARPLSFGHFPASGGRLQRPGPGIPRCRFALAPPSRSERGGQPPFPTPLEPGFRRDDDVIIRSRYCLGRLGLLGLLGRLGRGLRG